MHAKTVWRTVWSFEMGLQRGWVRPQWSPKISLSWFWYRELFWFEKYESFPIKKRIQIHQNILQNCFSILAVNHPYYNNQLFMFFENYCSTTLDTYLKPNAITYLDHLPEGSKEIIPSDMPQFRDLDKPEQREEFAVLLEKTASSSSVREN